MVKRWRKSKRKPKNSASPLPPTQALLEKLLEKRLAVLRADSQCQPHADAHQSNPD
jgi:hypothetical protein